MFAISPATPAATGLTKEIRQKMGQNYTDTGIAEEHAVAFASGAAKNGARPVLEVMSSFIQRTYDQLSQDLALNNSARHNPRLWRRHIGVDMTHLGIFVIPLISIFQTLCTFLLPQKKNTSQCLIGLYRKTPILLQSESLRRVVSTGHADKTTIQNHTNTK